MRRLIVIFWLGLLTVPAAADEAPAMQAARFAGLALDCVHREYPNKISHVMTGDSDVAPPRLLTPVFYGCFDWHSSVHGHWLLARLARLHPDAPFAVAARAALNESLTGAGVAAELAYLRADGRTSFERPYGLAWLLQLGTELAGWQDPDALRWSHTLDPLERIAAQRITDWLPKLAYPIRTGEHSQTAFAFGLILDWARMRGDAQLEALIVERSMTLYGNDAGCPLAYEPSGQDFLSPCLAEADLMRRIRKPADFAAWLLSFLPDIAGDGSTAWLPVAIVTDRSDGKLAHLDGLNLSRAWMLQGIASALPAGDRRIAAIDAGSRAHTDAGLASVTGEHYEGGHWLASFATYLTTRRGIE